MFAVGIMLSTNDPDNGEDTGRATAICAHWGKHGDVLELRADDGFWNDRTHRVTGGIACRTIPSNRFLPNGRGILLLRHRRFPYLRHVDWYGNWCWRIVVVDIQTANEIFKYLHSMGDKWNCEGGLTRIYEFWRGKRWTLS